MGYRPASLMRVTTDYTFHLKENGEFEYAALGLGGKDAYVIKGSIPISLEEWEERLLGIELLNVPEPDPSEPRVADLPELSVVIREGKQPWQRTLRPNDIVAVKLHRLIQEVVMGAREIPTEAFSSRPSENQRVDSPVVVKSAEEAAGFFKTEVIEQIDWGTQQIVLFRWSGSGQDQLEACRVARDEEGSGPKLQFSYSPGMTRDLRHHQAAWVIGRETPWELHRP